MGPVEIPRALGTQAGRERIRLTRERVEPPLSVRPPVHTLAGMAVVPNPDQPEVLTVVPPEEALRLARPLPDADDMAIEGLTDDEWEAFEQALAER